MELNLNEEQIQIIVDALFGYKIELKNLSEEELKREGAQKTKDTIFVIENELLPILQPE
ncbi:MAG: hypothetical protein AAFO07_33610 [Bacteroidota bacterium]